jgi:ADP-heptose:LPS heptosyltransferase
VKRHALSSYEHTTSLIAALDAVISVDTSVAHLAANIGKPTHLLLCPYEDWRWGTGDTTPWYPSMRLYRANLGRAVKKIAARLRELVPREVA